MKLRPFYNKHKPPQRGNNRSTARLHKYWRSLYNTKSNLLFKSEHTRALSEGDSSTTLADQRILSNRLCYALSELFECWKCLGFLSRLIGLRKGIYFSNFANFRSVCADKCRVSIKGLLFEIPLAGQIQYFDRYSQKLH